MLFSMNMNEMICGRSRQTAEGTFNRHWAAGVGSGVE